MLECQAIVHLNNWQGDLDKQSVGFYLDEPGLREREPGLWLYLNGISDKAVFVPLREIIDLKIEVWVRSSRYNMQRNFYTILSKKNGTTSAETINRLAEEVEGCYHQTYELLLAAHQIRNMILNHIKREGETDNKQARRISVDKSTATPDTSGISVAQLQGYSISQKQQPSTKNTNKRVTESLKNVFLNEINEMYKNAIKHVLTSWNSGNCALFSRVDEDEMLALFEKSMPEKSKHRYDDTLSFRNHQPKHVKDKPEVIRTKKLKALRGFLADSRSANKNTLIYFAICSTMRYAAQGITGKALSELISTSSL